MQRELRDPKPTDSMAVGSNISDVPIKMASGSEMKQLQRELRALKKSIRLTVRRQEHDVKLMGLSILELLWMLAVVVIAGAFAGARLKREFRWEACDDVRELRRHLIGAFLMGTGGILAYGCTVGQGLSAASALSLTAPVTIMAIALGSRIGIAWLVEGDLRGVFARVRLAFGRQDP